MSKFDHLMEIKTDLTLKQKSLNVCVSVQNPRWMGTGQCGLPGQTAQLIVTGGYRLAAGPVPTPSPSEGEYPVQATKTNGECVIVTHVKVS